MLNTAKAVVLEAAGSPVVKAVGGGTAATLAFRMTTGTKDSFVLGLVFAAGAAVALKGMENDSEVSDGNGSKS